MGCGRRRRRSGGRGGRRSCGRSGRHSRWCGSVVTLAPYATNRRAVRPSLAKFLVHVVRSAVVDLRHAVAVERTASLEAVALRAPRLFARISRRLFDRKVDVRKGGVAGMLFDRSRLLRRSRRQATCCLGLPDASSRGPCCRCPEPAVDITENETKTAVDMVELTSCTAGAPVRA